MKIKLIRKHPAFKSSVGNFWISTEYIGYGDVLGDGSMILNYETAVFNNGKQIGVERYSNLLSAITGHIKTEINYECESLNPKRLEVII